MFRLLTDDRVHAIFDKRPLDVGSNLIARTASSASDHVLDAILCLLAGADFLAGEGIAPDAADRGRVEHEGWIRVRAPEDG